MPIKNSKKSPAVAPATTWDTAAPFKEENILALAEAISGDEFQDIPQIETKGDLPKSHIDFLQRNLEEISGYSKGACHLLEIGCGSGRLFDVLDVTHAIDPSIAMLDRALKTVQRLGREDIMTLRHGYAENIPFKDKEFHAVVFTNGFFQVRSDYEALIEINRCLQIGGRFIFNLYTDDSQDIVCGRVLGPLNYLRVLQEFGFRQVEYRPANGFVCVEKVRDFDLTWLRKLQLVQTKDGIQMLNFHSQRDGTLV